MFAADAARFKLSGRVRATLRPPHSAASSARPAPGASEVESQPQTRAHGVPAMTASEFGPFAFPISDFGPKIRIWTKYLNLNQKYLNLDQKYLILDQKSEFGPNTLIWTKNENLNQISAFGPKLS